MILLRIIVAVTLVITTLDAFTDELPVYVYQRPGINVRFMPGPCVDVHVLRILAEVPHLVIRFHQATSMVNQRTRVGCWIEYTNQGIVVLVLADGSTFKVPLDRLARPKAA